MEKTPFLVSLLPPILIIMYLMFPILTTAESNITIDQYALLALKSRVTSDPYGAMENWAASISVCNWTGVTCGSRHHRVTELNISYMGLVGDIPPQFGNLSYLTYVDISINQFSGNLPQEFARLQRLRSVWLGYNSFTGEVPSLFAFLPELQLLSLSYNSFTNLNSFFYAFSSINETKLQSLFLRNNNIEGTIPESIGNIFPDLQQLRLGSNQLSGSIPSSMGNMSSLVFLDLQNNHLTGSIPVEIFNISTLEIMAFTNNTLSGSLPQDMCIGLPLLSELYLSTNGMNGQIPSNFSSCPQLQYLAMANNSFTGTIPTDIWSLEMLEGLYLAFNKLTGTIPLEVNQLRNINIIQLGRNMLTGTIPYTIFNLSSLQHLYLHTNELSGPLEEDFGNLTMLVNLILYDNTFTGVIPESLTKLQGLQALNLGDNRLSGYVPPGIFNISALTSISLSTNKLFGNLPSNIGYHLPNLEELYLHTNNFHSVLPNSIINASKLTVLELSVNRFTGAIPDLIGELGLLQIMHLAGNSFASDSTSTPLSFIASLVNCRYLRELTLSGNPLNGILPVSLGNFSSSLQILDASGCQINGYLPNEIGNLSGLIQLSLTGNNLDGHIPTTINGLQNLQQLYLGGNQLKQLIPNSLCRLKNLAFLSFWNNQLGGSIPECIGNMSSLRTIYLTSNNLISNVPSSIWDLKDLLELDISSNSFNGSLSPQIGNLKAAIYINVSANRFSGYLPNTFGGMQGLINLSLASNRFQGPIPGSMGTMLNLASLDLSNNKLSGTIPKSLESLTQLEYFNVSFNELSGEIPTGGRFSNFTSKSFMHNAALCGLPKYEVSICKKLKTRKVPRNVFIILGIAALVITVSFIITVILIKRRRKNILPTASSDISFTGYIERFSYYTLLNATNGFGESNFLGRGSFGSVYKGVFGDGIFYAIKVFNMQVEGAWKTFDKECEVLRNLRHRNLTKVISSCSNQEFMALVLEYMPNGSLETLLHHTETILPIMQRLDMMIDVASALEYLHHGYSTPIIHCDLKPGNILLDENMVAHVSDFGIAKLLGEGESITHTMTLATIGYMAPEYGLEGLVSTRGDVYSYGIMLLETFTGKQPGDEMFSGELCLKSWVKDSLPNEISGVVDTSLLRPDEENFGENMDCISSILELALSCLSNSPNDRMNMQNVLAELKKIKNQFVVLKKKIPE